MRGAFIVRDERINLNPWIYQTVQIDLVVKMHMRFWSLSHLFLLPSFLGFFPFNFISSSPFCCWYNLFHPFITTVSIQVKKGTKLWLLFHRRQSRENLMMHKINPP